MRAIGGEVESKLHMATYVAEAGGLRVRLV